MAEYNHNHQAQGERQTWYVLILTFTVMILEITAGTLFGSMALLADGWHMGTHAAAFCITLFTYHYARKNRDNQKFTFGTGKVGVLGGYTSAIVLGLVALLMAGESIHRIVEPASIQFNDAIVVAFIGLAVNVLSMFLLGEKDPEHHQSHAPHDHNLKAAYIHVLADALTSVLAIVALFVGKYLGWYWLDPIMGIVGSVIILKWGYGLLVDTSRILLDQNVAPDYAEQIQQVIEKQGGQVLSLRLWPVSADDYAAMVVISGASELSLSVCRQQLLELSHLHYLSLESKEE